jgi:hypothetical protein
MPFVKDSLIFLAIVLAWLLGAFIVYYTGTVMLHVVPAAPSLFVYSNVLWISPICFAGILFLRARRQLSGLTFVDRQLRAKQVILQQAKRFIVVTGGLYLLGYLFTLIWPATA